MFVHLQGAGNVACAAECAAQMRRALSRDIVHAKRRQTQRQTGIERNDKKWKQTLKRLKKGDWSRSNPDWAGRCVVNGSMYNNTKAAKLTCIKIKQLMSIELSESEKAAEQTLQKEVTQQ